MTKLTPDKLLSPSTITFSDIKVNSYSRPFSEEVEYYGKETLINVLSDMLYVREFESTLKKSREKSLLGYKFTYPAHLSIGQEAVAVGEALALNENDIIFGTHRSHGEFLAKSLRAIRLYEEDKLEDIISNYPTATYSAIKDFLNGNAKENATLFILYGAFSEIFARTTGLTRGLGGSMHLHFIPFGSYPNNGIVGGSAPLAVGSALFDRVNGGHTLTVANVGDGAVNCGAVYESIAFATMHQFNNLWKEKKGLPLLFVVIDNLYARGGNTKLETGSYDNPARLGAGFTKNQMFSESVNGLNPLAVADAISRHRNIALEGNGATIVNCTTYRHEEHSISDKLNRDRTEIESWLALDPIVTYSKLLVENGILSQNDVETLKKEVKERVLYAYELAINEKISPVVDLKKENDYILKLIYNEGYIAPTSPDNALKASPIYEELTRKNGENFTLRDAISLGIMEGYLNYPSFISYGEDVRGWQSKKSVFFDFDKYIPQEKLFNTPIAESAIVGAEIGYAMRGGNVIAELLYADFLTRASDEIINQASKWQTLSGGTIKLPMTLRLPVGRSYGGQHSQDLSGLIARVNGLKVYYPTTPSDMLSVMRSAIASTDPTVIFEPKEFYDYTDPCANPLKVDNTLVKTSIKKEGNDITIVTIGPSLYDALSVSKECNKDLEIISLVSLNPIDYAPIINSVNKTGKLIIMGESPVTSGIMSNVCAVVQKSCFNSLKAPIEILGSPNTIVPPNGTESGYYCLKEQLLSLIWN
ncbi:MAG: dehydrogenase [Clostridia bacterium]|nr:dehydrogenase [Clostridia bacterium]